MLRAEGGAVERQPLQETVRPETSVDHGRGLSREAGQRRSARHTGRSQAAGELLAHGGLGDPHSRKVGC